MARPRKAAASARPASAQPEFYPAQQWAPLQAGAKALGLSLDDAQIDRLLRFGALLARWSAVHNLTAIRRGDEIVTHHLLDSLAIVPELQRLAAGRSLSILDVGSGGGLPGVPIAIALPDMMVTLVETVQKKCAFLVQAALELALPNVTVIHARVEGLRGQYDVITSRAFAAAGDFVRWTRHLRAPHGCWLAMKGRPDPDELAALPGGLRVRSVPLTVPGLDQARQLLEITAG